MKKFKKTFYCYAVLLLLSLLLAGCADNVKEQSKAAPSKNDSTLESKKAADEIAKAESEDLPADTSSKEKTTESETNNPLADYSSEQIEYARVWLQLGPNQEIDELNVRHIKAGSPLDPDDDKSLSYPENVIQLTGTRIVDGIVTYSSNGDGTINVYNVPLRWYGGLSRPDNISEDDIREEMEGMIKNTKLVHVNPSDDKKIIKIINKMNINENW